MKLREEPFLWLAFSGGGVIAAILMPVLALLFALALPLGWIDPPSPAHLGAVVMMLIHAAHRFRFTLYDGLQVKHRGLVAAICYGGAVVGIFVALDMLGSVT